MQRELCLGVVLAGGRGRRFGGDKAWVERRGRTLAAAAADSLSGHCDRVVVSLQRGAANPAPGRETVEDPPPGGRGPLSGIVAAGALQPSAALLVLACDYPQIDADRLGRLLESPDDEAALVLAVDEQGRDHPLVALWRPAAVELARRTLAAGVSRVGAVVEQLDVRRVRFGSTPTRPHPLLNVNRREQLPEG